MVDTRSLKRTGLSEKTTERFLTDAGAVYYFDKEDYFKPENWKQLGATRDGNEFTLEQELREIELDGLRGGVMGTKRVVNTFVSLSANLVEVSAENFKLAIPGAELEDWPPEEERENPDDLPTHSKLTRSRNICLSDYVDYVALVGDLSQDTCDGPAGEPVIFIIKNALAEEALNISTADEDEAVIELTLTGHYSFEDPDTEPWEIVYPKEKFDVNFKVIDSSDDEPLEGAEIEITETGNTEETNVYGKATHKLISHEYNYTVTLDGYSEETGEITIDGESKDITVEMTST